MQHPPPPRPGSLGFNNFWLPSPPSTVFPPRPMHRVGTLASAATGYRHERPCGRGRTGSPTHDAFIMSSAQNVVACEVTAALARHQVSAAASNQGGVAATLDQAHAFAPSPVDPLPSRQRPTGPPAGIAPPGSPSVCLTRTLASHLSHAGREPQQYPCGPLPWSTPLQPPYRSPPPPPPGSK